MKKLQTAKMKETKGTSLSSTFKIKVIPMGGIFKSNLAVNHSNYGKLKDKYAEEYRETVKKYKNKNDRQ